MIEDYSSLPYSFPWDYSFPFIPLAYPLISALSHTYLSLLISELSRRKVHLWRSTFWELCLHFLHTMSKIGIGTDTDRDNSFSFFSFFPFLSFLLPPHFALFWLHFSFHFRPFPLIKDNSIRQFGNIIKSKKKNYSNNFRFPIMPIIYLGWHLIGAL
jgi:hypothetical protein